MITCAAVHHYGRCTLCDVRQPATHAVQVLTLGGGWEYGLVDRQLGVDCDPDRSLLVTVSGTEGRSRARGWRVGHGEGPGALRCKVLAAAVPAA